jgi:hypothetical protein
VAIAAGVFVVCDARLENGGDHPETPAHPSTDRLTERGAIRRLPQGRSQR